MIQQLKAGAEALATTDDNGLNFKNVATTPKYERKFRHLGQDHLVYQHKSRYLNLSRIFASFCAAQARK